MIGIGAAVVAGRRHDLGATEALAAQRIGHIAKAALATTGPGQRRGQPLAPGMFEQGLLRQPQFSLQCRRQTGLAVQPLDLAVQPVQALT